MSNKYKKNNIKLVNIWINIIFVIVPLIFTNYYFNILRTKTYTFIIITCIFLILAISNSFIEGKFLNYLKPRTFIDYLFLIFIISAVISTLLSGEYILNSFWGNEGRYNGLLLYVLYFLSYIFVRRDFVYNKKVFDIFILVSILVALFGITDFFDMNLFGFKDNLERENWSTFYSTIGNINTYTAYLALPTGLSSCLFIFYDLDRLNKKALVFYYISSFIFYIALIVGNSDNAYISLFVLFIFVAFVAFRHKESFLRYLLLFASFLLSIEIVECIIKIEGEKVATIDGIFPFIMNFKYFIYLLVFFWILVIIVSFINKKIKNFNIISKVLSIFWGVIIFSFFIIILYYLYQANLTKDWDKYGSFSKYLIFNNAWGSRRGYIWKAAIEEYVKFSPLNKLFGYGLETFGIYMYNFKYDEMVRTTGFYFDSAHNEYIQYLFTHGILGVVSYVLILIYTFVSGIKLIIKKKVIKEKSAIILALVYSILMYAMQAIVNINIPISSVFFFMFIMITNKLIYEDENIN